MPRICNHRSRADGPFRRPHRYALPFHDEMLEALALGEACVPGAYGGQVPLADAEMAATIARAGRHRGR